MGPPKVSLLVDELEAGGSLSDYYLLPATRADLLRRLGRAEEAAACLSPRHWDGALRPRASLHAGTAFRVEVVHSPVEHLMPAMSTSADFGCQSAGSSRADAVISSRLHVFGNGIDVMAKLPPSHAGMTRPDM